MNCITCNSTRVGSVSAKCSDMFDISVNEYSYEGYVVDGIGIGGGDYVAFDYCLDCGQIQRKFPVEEADFEKLVSEDTVKTFYDTHLNEGDSIDNYTRQFSKSSIVIAAHDIHPRFGRWFDNFLNYNKNFHDKKLMPSQKEFVRMFNDNELIV